MKKTANEAKQKISLQKLKHNQFKCKKTKIEKIVNNKLWGKMEEE